MNISPAEMVAEIYRGTLRSSGVDASLSEPECSRVTLTCIVPEGVMGNTGDEASIDMVFDAGNVVFFYSQLTPRISSASTEEARSIVNNLNSTSNPYSVILNENGVAVIAFSYMTIPTVADSQLATSEEMRTLTAELDALFEKIVDLSGKTNAIFSNLQIDDRLDSKDPATIVSNEKPGDNVSMNDLMGKLETYDDDGDSESEARASDKRNTPSKRHVSPQGEGDSRRANARQDRLERKSTREKPSSGSTVDREMKKANRLGKTGTGSDRVAEKDGSPFDFADDFDDIDFDDYILEEEEGDERRDILDRLAHVSAVCIAISKSSRANMPEDKREALSKAGNYTVRSIWVLATSYDAGKSEAVSWQAKPIETDDFKTWGRESGTVGAIAAEARRISALPAADMMKELVAADATIKEIEGKIPEQFAGTEKLDLAVLDIGETKKALESLKKKKKAK